nr:ribonuclease H-like domain, reverse transcriptase, RNA-dependent DNA polymerase [Tanacetum cinerariifolium]
TAAATQASWLKRLLRKLAHSEEEKVTIRVDNKSAIALMKNPVFHGRSKHIDTKYHFIRECVEREDIQVEFVSGEYQKADTLTKPLPKIKFLTMRQLIGLIEVASKLSHGGLEFSFRRNPRGGVEQAQFEMLKEMVEGVTLRVHTFDPSDLRCYVNTVFSRFVVRLLIFLFGLDDEETSAFQLTSR